MSAPIEHIEWGRVAYPTALERMVARRDAVLSGERAEAVFTLEHDPVITLGRRASPEHLLIDRAALAARGIEVVEVDRGGEATYHGPGQLVVYAVIHCGARRIGPSDLVRMLAAAVSEEVETLGVRTAYDTEHPGLWVDGAKLAAVGMRISRGVSTHGLALNVSTSLDAFSLFIPCGMPGARATSLRAQLGVEPPDLRVLGAAVAGRLIARLGAGTDMS